MCTCTREVDIYITLVAEYVVSTCSKVSPVNDNIISVIKSKETLIEVGFPPRATKSDALKANIWHLWSQNANRQVVDTCILTCWYIGLINFE